MYYLNKWKTSFLILLLFVAALVITNPTIIDFKEYLKVNKVIEGESYLIKKENNFFVFSVYSIELNNKEVDNIHFVNYYAVFGKFFKKYEVIS